MQIDLLSILTLANVLAASTVVIVAFSLLAYTLTYNFRHPVSHHFALLLGLVVIVYASDVALNRVISAQSAERWLRFQWVGIALLPWAYYIFSTSVLRTTNFRTGRRAWIGYVIGGTGLASAFVALFTELTVKDVIFAPPISYMESGPLFWPFSLFFGLAALLSYHNIWKARQRCLTAASRARMTYLLFGFLAPALGTFPYLVAFTDRARGGPFPMPIILLSILGNLAVAALLLGMANTVAYFGIYTPDRVVRYRLLRYFTRGPIVAILVILAIQTIPTVERILGIPRDMVLFSVITGVIVLSQLVLSITKSVVDRIIYREDREEIAWLRELDRRLLTTSDLRQFLENHLTGLCELLRVPSGFVASVTGPNLILEAVVGPDGTRSEVAEIQDWSEALTQALRSEEPGRPGTAPLVRYGPVHHRGYWVWPLVEQESAGEKETVLGILGIKARTEAPLFTLEEKSVLAQMIDSIGLSLIDRKLQKQVFVILQQIIPGIDRIQQIRGVVPYASEDTEIAPAQLLEPSPIHNPEFESWVKDALSHYWGGPKLTRSPLIQLRVVAGALERADGIPTKALRLVLGHAIEKLRPTGQQDLSTPEWLLYNILEMRFIQGRKVREIAERLAVSESDLYRKQRIAIGQVAQVLSEMEQTDRDELLSGELRVVSQPIETPVVERVDQG